MQCKLIAQQLWLDCSATVPAKNDLQSELSRWFTLSTVLRQVMDTGISTSPATSLCRLGTGFVFLGSFTGDSFLVHTFAEVLAVLHGMLT